jgi:ketosteroid isomerase-like protein
MSRKNIEVVRAGVDAFVARDFDAVVRLYKPGASITAVPDGWPEPAPVEGREAVMLQFMRLQEDWEEHSLTIEREVAERDWVIVDFRWETRGTGSGVSLKTNVAAAYRLEGAQIAEARFFWKWEDALEAAGLPEEETSLANLELVRRNFDLWSRGADDEFVRQVAPDVEWHHNVGVGSPLEGLYRGRREVLELFNAIRDSFGVAHFELEELRELSATEVLALGRLHLEGRGSGAAVATPFGAVIEIVAGLAVRQQFWTDQSKALEAAGLSEPAPNADS